ncbi:two-component system sensor histidine kinase DesK [Streptacidiphilus sp. MAP12-20]|uniref:sensor histidine kinase n=1 Tax=Streptacidiphilus sp. MAP12-20 TaxID=3156299 RepID=UPI00351129F3
MSEERPVGPRIGVPPENRRQMFVKLCWTLLWLIYLAYPVGDLLSGDHTTAGTVFGWAMLTGFLACYVYLILRRQVAGTALPWARWQGGVLLAMLTLSIVTTLGLNNNWLALFSYTAISAGAVLPARYAFYGVLGTAGLQFGLGIATHTPGSELSGIVISAMLGGLAMTGLQRLVCTMQELREARQAVAALAASDERLRLARDLHDLLGHSLSLITLKTELTSRFMDQERYPEAREQVADIEKVSRQALVDVREAIGGYRRPKLAVELAAARTALTAADVAIDAPLSLADPRPGLDAEAEGALGWALREAVTNVVRHSNASQCRIRLIEDHAPIGGGGGRVLTLEILDNGGSQGKHSSPGNGLTGLAERLALTDGRLDAGPAKGGHGFLLRATVPLREPITADAEPVAGTVQE